MENTRKILVTSALPYANAPLHLGHMVEYLQTDFWVRFQKLRGNDCRYFCADDTHGTPIFLNARKQGISPEDLIAKSHTRNKQDFADFGIEFTHYSSTNTETNRKLCEDMFLEMEKQNHISTKPVEQAYCEHDNMFLPDRLVKGSCPKCKATDQWGDSCDVCSATYSPTDVIDPACSICGNPPTKKSSDHLFFELDHFRDFLKEWVPQGNSPEVTAKLSDWMQGELRPWDISRDAPYFGFEIPGHAGKYFYVWVDAPIGYIAASKDWADSQGKDFADDWNETSDVELYHFIGKDIVYFHSLFWPAMLKASNYRRPNKVFVHGFLMVNGKKMSKSKGTFIEARTYLDHCDSEYLRYYYGCKLNSGMDDIDLNLEDFVQRVNSDLVGKFINLGSRSAKVLKTHFEGQLGSEETLDAEGSALIAKAQQAEGSIAQHYENRDFSKAMVEVRDLVDEANRYFDAMQPWKSVKVDKASALGPLTVALSIFRICAVYLTPVLPEVTTKVRTLFSESPWAWSDSQKSICSVQMGEFSHLMKRLDGKQMEKIVGASEKAP